MASKCTLPASDGMWLQATVTTWEAGMEEIFGYRPERLPLLLIIGSECLWATGAGGCDLVDGRALDEVVYAERAYGLCGAAHSGEVKMPSGQVLTPVPFAFSAPDDSGGIFTAVASADIWSERFPSDAIPNVPDFIKGVVAHELIHTQQEGALKRLVAVSESNPEYADLDDELLQREFGDTPGYVAAMRAERANLIHAIKAADDGEARRMAAEILKNYRARQASYFQDRYEILRALEDTFLTMEGLAVWFTFQIAPPEGVSGGDPTEVADYYAKRTEGSWVQSHGGLFVALIDRLDPNWRGRAFEQDLTLPDLLESAAEQ